MLNFIASAGTTNEGGSITNPVLNPSLQQAVTSSPSYFFSLFLPRLITLALIIGSLIFFFIMITGAIQWISSSGDKNALEAAKGKITNAIVGLLILFSLFAILKVIEGFFGIKILTLDIQSLVIQ